MKARLINHMTAVTLVVATLSAVLLTFLCPSALAQGLAAQSINARQALISQDAVALRAAPHDSATMQAQLWQGELVEVRGERLDYVQVWDYKRERGGYVRANQLHLVAFTPTDADSLLAVLRFVKDTHGSEGLSLGYGAAWLKAAPASLMSSATGAEVLDAIGSAAERLARRASTAGLSKSAQDTVAAQLDAAQRYGIRFESYEREGKVTLCYDGEVFSRVLTMQTASNEHRSRAALALTRSECEDPKLSLTGRSQNDEWRAELLDKAASEGLNGTLQNRLHMRRASLWSSIAYELARSGKSNAAQAAQRSLDEIAHVNKLELPDEDQGLFNDAVMRVNASRWAAVGAASHTDKGLRLNTEAGTAAGETCIQLVDDKRVILAKRCTYGVVWPNSFSINREASAATLAVQPLAGWRELWLLRKQGNEWHVEVMPPALSQPELGYAEFAGWVPGGQQMLLARESRSEGRYKRNYEVVDINTLVTQRQANDPALLGAFQRWQQPQWKQLTASLR
jgi:hypothetical protein